jgi:hypothetical protein
MGEKKIRENGGGGGAGWICEPHSPPLQPSKATFNYYYFFMRTNLNF